MATRKSRPNARAVFLDRDGVIVQEVDYLTDPKQLRLLPGAASAIAELKCAGFKCVVVSNQSAVARGWLTLKGLAKITSVLQGMLQRQGAGLDAVYYCPHHPEVGRKVRCSCRKPALGMIKKAAKRYGLSLRSCFYIGDTTTDMLTARRAGMPGLLVRTGYGGRDRAYRVKPARTFKDLAAAARWIIRNCRGSSSATSGKESRNEGVL